MSALIPPWQRRNVGQRTERPKWNFRWNKIASAPRSNVSTLSRAQFHRATRINAIARNAAAVIWHAWRCQMVKITTPRPDSLASANPKKRSCVESNPFCLTRFARVDRTAGLQTTPFKIETRFNRRNRGNARRDRGRATNFTGVETGPRPRVSRS